MFGMSSIEFWEGEPQLYWAYRFSFEKKVEMENNRQRELLRFDNWLNGKFTEMAVELALNNSFTKKRKEYPDYEKLFESEQKNEAQKVIEEQSQGITDKNTLANIQYNYWARN